VKPEHWNKIEALYLEARELAPAERPRFLRERCGAETELEREVQRLLDADDTDSKFIEPPSAAGIADVYERDYIGQSFGEFELIERIASGGMGVVYRAHQRSLDRDVAVKVLPPSPLVDDHKRTRFEREAQAVARLNHPAIVPVYSVGINKDTPYFAMEYVHGPDLAHEILRLRGHEPASGAGLPSFGAPDYFATVARLIADVADGLQHAHDHGVVHRDVKPSNLLIDERGRLRIVDFGLARNEMLGTITRTHEQAGTPYYMSPEQVRASLGAVDWRTDVYSLGVVLYELLTLRRPFQGRTSVEVFSQIVNIEPTPLRRANPRVPHDLAVVCHAAMARELADRYASAAEFRDELMRFVAHEAIHRRPPSIARRVSRFVSRHRVAVGVALVAALALGVGGQLARRHARTLELDQHRAAFERVLGLASWDGALDQVVDARRRWLSLHDTVDDLSSELRAEFEQLKERFSSDRNTRLALARRLLARGRAGRRDPAIYGEFISPVSERDLADAMRVLADAHTLYWDDREIEQLANIRSTFPLISVRLSSRTLAATPKAAQAIVSIRAIDELTGARGERTVLGNAPLERVPIAAGSWRISVEIPDWGFAEYTRWLQPFVEPTEIVANVPEADTVRQGMKLIEAGRLVVKQAFGCEGFREHIDYEGFLIDESVASNREYVDFLSESGHAAPWLWRKVGYRDDWHQLPLGDHAATFLDMPATGLSFLDAVDYAEWRGRRLPGHIELERALRGSKGLELPSDYSTDVALAGAANISGPRAEGGPTLEAWFDTYLANVQPVRDPRFKQLPEGLFHAYGNVMQYTESMVALPRGGMLITDPWQRIYLGSAWDGLTFDRHSLANHATINVAENTAKTFIGIRCARSAAP